MRKVMAVQAPPEAAALLLRSLTRLMSEVMPTPDAFLNSSTFVSVRRLCSTAVLHKHRHNCCRPCKTRTTAEVNNIQCRLNGNAKQSLCRSHPSP